MDISVIIVTRNTDLLTRAAIKSVMESQDTLVKEVIVVDNGSTDATPQMIPQTFPQVAYIRSERNLGFAAACNQAAKNSSADFLVLLNSDAVLAPEALGKSVAWMRANSGCAVAGGQLLKPDGARQNSIANFPTLATELLNKSMLRMLRSKKYPGKAVNFSEPVEVETVVGAFMIIRKSVWDLIGGLDQRFFFFFEETDFCFQSRKRGFTVVHLPQVQVWHGQGQTAKQVSVGARIEYWRSRYIYFAKNQSRTTRTCLAVGLMFRLALDSLFALLFFLATAGQSSRWRGRLHLYSSLIVWHLRGRPAASGLPR